MSIEEKKLIKFILPYFLSIFVNICFINFFPLIIPTISQICKGCKIKSETFGVPVCQPKGRHPGFLVQPVFSPMWLCSLFMLEVHEEIRSQGRTTQS